MNINVMVYPYRHISKPEKEEREQVINKMVMETLTYSELINAINRGYAICPAIFEGKMLQENWRSQQLFFVDVDNDGLYPKRSVREQLDLCEQRGLVPIHVYGSFSYTFENQRHHIIFSLDKPIDDPKLRIRIQTKFNQLFCGDGTTLQANYFFFGGIYNFFPNRYPKPEELIHPEDALFAQNGSIITG